MVVTSSGIVNGVIGDQYGKHGTQLNQNGMPTYSLPLKIRYAPRATASFAIVLEDKDAYPHNGFVWIHWMAANVRKYEITENESQTAGDFLQGANSWISMEGGKQSRELSSFYGGMSPPDKPHVYEIRVFALNTVLNLKNGFYLNELYKEMDNHVIDQFTLRGIYNN